LSERLPLKAVLFDWDGTLVDSAAATLACYRQLFESYGITFDDRRFQETYAPDWHQTYRLVGLAEEHWGEADSRWLELYANQRALPTPGARAVLTRLTNAGLRLGVVTSGARCRVEGEVAALSFDRNLPTLVCAGEAPRPKPAPDPLLLALTRMDITPEHAAYVGDSPEDVHMARAAGAYVIGIPGGFPNREALAAAAPDFLAASLARAADHLLAETDTHARL
jgi:HAD superfamily hydrolase (TIGR01509 family)